MPSPPYLIPKTGFSGQRGQSLVEFAVSSVVLLLLIGGLVSTIGYAPFFVALAALDLVAAVVVWTVIRKPAAHA